MTTLAASGAEPGAESPTRRGSYGRYVLGKVLGAMGSLLFVLVVNFFLFRVLPGDPARTLGRGRLSTPEQLAEFNATYGLDQPLAQQFVTFLRNTVQGDLGYSLLYHQDVSGILAARLWPTLLLVGSSALRTAWCRRTSTSRNPLARAVTG